MAAIPPKLLARVAPSSESNETSETFAEVRVARRLNSSTISIVLLSSSFGESAPQSGQVGISVLDC